VKKVITVHTKLDKTSPSKTTVLTLDYTGATVLDLMGPAQDSLVISWQGRARRAKAIPATASVNVREFIASLAKRESAPETPETLFAKAQAMSPQELERYIALLKAKVPVGGSDKKAA
jgi:hypothetical protein